MADYVSPSWGSSFKSVEFRPSTNSFIFKTRSPLYPRPFRFLEAWIRDPTREEIINKAWHSKNGTRQRVPMWSRMYNTAKPLRQWNKDSFGFCQSMIQTLESDLARLFSSPPLGENLRHQHSTQSTLDEWRLTLELVWRQKSRELWLTAGDRNSQFFHASTIDKRRKNSIVALKDDSGLWLESRSDIGTYLAFKFT